MAAIGGLDPSVLVAPDYQTNMMQAQHRLALAQQLQQMSMQDTPGNGGSVSWTQGLARLADAIVGGIAARKGYQQMQGANQAYARGMASLFGMPQQTTQMGQGAPPSPGGPPMPQQAPQAPPQAPAGPQAAIDATRGPITPGDEPLNNAPPQAAPPQPAAAPMPPQGGAPSMGPMNLTGDPRRDMGLYVMNPEEYGKAMIGNAAKGGAPTDTEVMVAHARQALASGDVATATALLGNLEKQNYIAPTAARPGGWTQDPHTGQWMFHPQAPIPGAVPGPLDAQGNMTWQVPAGTEAAIAERAKSQSAGESAGKAPYQFQDVYNPTTGQMEHVPVSEMAGQGGGSLNQYYGHGASQGGAPGAPPGGGHYAAAPPIGATAAANTYGQGSAQGALETQNSAEGSQIRVQAYREMQNLLHGGLSTGPTQARMQELAEEHGLSFLAKDNAFVFNKDAALAVAQQAKALGLNSSDARFEAVARATPNMKMTPQALAQVIPVRIGMEYASQAEATANANWIAQHGPQTNPQFKNYWRQNYDPRMFTAYAQGGPQALAHAPPQLRQQWLSDYRNLKALGVNFGQFAQ